MVLMCISCGWTPDDLPGERDVVEYALPGKAGVRVLCTDCLYAASEAWVAKSLPKSLGASPLGPPKGRSSKPTVDSHALLA